jgi:antirestriction protein
MTIYVESQRIYVASLKDYNAGNHHGVWIDLNLAIDLDDVWNQINEMLASSPDFKEFPQGGPAEEWAIHDFEGFGTYRLSEYDSIAKVFRVAKLIEEKGVAASEWLANDETPATNNETAYDLIDWFDGCFMGEFDSEREYAEHFVDELGLPDIGVATVNTGPDWNPKPVKVTEALYSYLDWDALTEWATQDQTVVEIGNGRIAVFRSEP